MPITLYPGSMKKRNANGSYSDLVPAIATDPEVLDDFAEEYSTSETYNIGDYCIHNSDLYKCNTNNTTGTWNNNAWDRVTVSDELSDHKNTLTQLDEDKAEKVDLVGNIILNGTNTTGADITAGTYFYNNGTLKRAIATISGNPAGTVTDQNSETVTAGGLNALNNSLSVIGTVVNGTLASSLVVPSGAYTTICTVTLSPGKWIIFAGHQWTASFTQGANMRLVKGTSGITGAVIRYQSAGGGGMTITWAVQPSATSTYGLSVYQSSGSSQTAEQIGMMAIRIA